MALDLDKLAEVRANIIKKLYFSQSEIDCILIFRPQMTAPWLTVRTVQGEVWMKLDRETDVNTVAANLEIKAKE